MCDCGYSSAESHVMGAVMSNTARAKKKVGQGTESERRGRLKGMGRERRAETDPEFSTWIEEVVGSRIKSAHMWNALMTQFLVPWFVYDHDPVESLTEMPQR